MNPPEPPTLGEPALAAEPTPHPRKRTVIMPIEDVIPETRDTVTLVFGPPSEFHPDPDPDSNTEPGDHFGYRAGQFMLIDPHQFPALAQLIAWMEHARGHRESPRAYSISSAPDEPRLAVTVKEQPFAPAPPGETTWPPLVSPYLVRHDLRGLPVTLVGPSGAYVLPDDIEARADHLVHLCAGSGSVPSFSIIKHVLAHHPRLRQTFVYSNRTWDDVIFRDALTALGRAHGDRLRVIHTLTRAGHLPARGDDGGMHPNVKAVEVRRGRVDAALLSDIIDDPRRVLVFACGPAVDAADRARARARGVEPAPRFMETVLDALRSLGVPRDRIRRESWG